jgi:hypothetical protein
VQDKPCNLGDPIKKHSKVRLQHGPTRKWLHSHQYQSPLSGNQEVRSQLLLLLLLLLLLQAIMAHCWFMPAVADAVIYCAWVTLHTAWQELPTHADCLVVAGHQPTHKQELLLLQQHLCCCAGQLLWR